jgi:hypothetical protein
MDWVNINKNTSHITTKFTPPSKLMGTYGGRIISSLTCVNNILLGGLGQSALEFACDISNDTVPWSFNGFQASSITAMLPCLQSFPNKMFYGFYDGAKFGFKNIGLNEPFYPPLTINDLNSNHHYIRSFCLYQDSILFFGTSARIEDTSSNSLASLYKYNLLTNQLSFVEHIKYSTQIWSLVSVNNHIYGATSNGFFDYNILQNRIIEGHSRGSGTAYFPSAYSLAVIGSKLYVLINNGNFQIMIFSSDSVNSISSPHYFNIHDNNGGYNAAGGELLAGNDDRLYVCYNGWNDKGDSTKSFLDRIDLSDSLVLTHVLPPSPDYVTNRIYSITKDYGDKNNKSFYVGFESGKVLEIISN